MGRDFVRDAPGSFDDLSGVSLCPDLLLQQRDAGDGLERALSPPMGGGQTHGKGVSRRRSLQRESFCFMKGVMDECTHIANFSGEQRIRTMRETFWRVWMRCLV